MNFLQALRALEPTFDPRHAKIHLAVRTRMHDPVELFERDEFEEWQEWQTRRNFERPKVISLIALPGRKRWLFAGVHDSNGSKHRKCPTPHFRYVLKNDKRFGNLEGRLIVGFHRTSRQSYLLAEKWIDQMVVDEILAGRHQVAEFPGYSGAMLTKARLDLVVARQIQSWKSALSSVSGIYVIADRNTGRLYVGSATGEGGIWNRWCEYSATGHGQNKELKALLRKRGRKYAENFQFAVLEIADSHAVKEDVLARESHWKEVLLTREFGLNAN